MCTYPTVQERTGRKSLVWRRLRNPKQRTRVLAPVDARARHAWPETQDASAQ